MYNAETRFLCWVIRWVMVPFVDMENTTRELFCKELQNKNFLDSGLGAYIRLVNSCQCMDKTNTVL